MNSLYKLYYLQWNKFYVVSSKKREVLWHRTLDRVVVRKNHIMLIDLRQFNQIIIKTEPMTTNNENGGFNYVFKMYISFIVFLFILKKMRKSNWKEWILFQWYLNLICTKSAFKSNIRKVTKKEHVSHNFWHIHVLNIVFLFFYLQ